MHATWSRTLRWDPREPVNFMAWTLRGILVAAIVAVWFVPSFSRMTSVSLAATGVVGLAGSLAIPTIPNRAQRDMRRVEVVWTSLFVLHIGGHVFSLYDVLPHYDKFLHATWGFLGGLAAFWVARATPLFWDEGKATAFRAFWVAFSVPTVAGAIVEVVEYASDGLLGAESQASPAFGRLDDTMLDLLAEMATGLAAGVLVAWWTYRRIGRPATGIARNGLADEPSNAGGGRRGGPGPRRRR